MAAQTKDETTKPVAENGNKVKRMHKATYATDKRKGGYLVRVVGPHASEFAGREVPVGLRSGDEQTEKLVKVVWSGKDQDSGEPVALYQFAAKPRAMDEIVF